MGENSFYLQPFGYLLFYIYLYRIMPCKVNSNPLFLQSVVNILTVVLAKHNHSSVPWHSRFQIWALSCSPTNTFMVNPSIKTKFGYHVGSLETRSGSLANGNNQLRRMTLIVKVGFLLLSVLSFKVRRHSLTHQRHAELHVDHQTVLTFTVLLWGNVSLHLGFSIQVFLGC